MISARVTYDGGHFSRRYSLCHEPDLFSAHVANDPSVWWDLGEQVPELEAFLKRFLADCDFGRPKEGEAGKDDKGKNGQKEEKADTSKQIAFFQSAAGDGGKPFALNLAVAAAFEGALSRGRHVDESKNCSAGNRLGEWGSADGHPLLRCESMAAHSYAWRRRGHLGSALGLRGAPRSSPAGPFAAGGSSSRCSRSGTTPPTCARSARACSGSTRPTTRGGAQSRKSASLRRAAERAAERAVGWPSPAARRAPVRCRINSAFREKAERPARSGSRSPTARPS